MEPGIKEIHTGTKLHIQQNAGITIRKSLINNGSLIELT